MNPALDWSCSPLVSKRIWDPTNRSHSHRDEPSIIHQGSLKRSIWRVGPKTWRWKMSCHPRFGANKACLHVRLFLNTLLMRRTSHLSICKDVQQSQCLPWKKLQASQNQGRGPPRLDRLNFLLEQPLRLMLWNCMQCAQVSHEHQARLAFDRFVPQRRICLCQKESPNSRARLGKVRFSAHLVLQFGKNRSSESVRTNCAIHRQPLTWQTPSRPLLRESIGCLQTHHRGMS